MSKSAQTPPTPPALDSSSTSITAELRRLASDPQRVSAFATALWTLASGGELEVLDKKGRPVSIMVKPDIRAAQLLIGLWSQIEAPADSSTVSDEYLAASLIEKLQ